MSLSTIIRAAMIADSGVSTLVGSRVYPRYLPQTPTYPAISYQRVSSSGQNGTTALRQTRYQIDCWASTVLEAEALAVAVKALFEEWSNTSGTPQVKMARVVNEIEEYDDELGISRNIVDVLFDTLGD